jgi:hypothetical protein
MLELSNKPPIRILYSHMCNSSTIAEDNSEFARQIIWGLRPNAFVSLRLN